MSEAKVIKFELNLGRLPQLINPLNLLKKLRSKPRIFTFLSILLLEVLTVGSYEGIFAYQTRRYIRDGETLFSNGQYQESLTVFQKADSAWRRTLFLEQLKESPTGWRVERTKAEVERLAKSHENYVEGIERFNTGGWSEAVDLLSKVEKDDPDHPDAQTKITDSQNKIAEAVAAKAAEEAKKGQVAGASTRVVYRTVIKESPPPPPPPAEITPLSPSPTVPIQLPVQPSTVTIQTIDGSATLLANDGTYLGVVSSNKYQTDSICNKYGTYGNPYSTKSVRNKYSTYGSPYSTQSAYNPYTSNPPKIIFQGQIVGYLTKNSYKAGAVDPDILFAVYGCSY